MTLRFAPDRTFRRLAKAGRATVGRGTYGAPKVLWWGEPDVRLDIGRYCSIADGVRLYLGGNHRTDWMTTYPFTEVPGMASRDEHPGHPASAGSIEIGHDVWVASSVTVLSGVRVGNGAVLGMGAVVAHDVPAYAIAVGNPARTVRRRFPDDVVAALEELRWWTLGEAAIGRLMPLLLSPDAPAFVAALREERARAGTGDERDEVEADEPQRPSPRWWKRR